jgi:hypothetical protein
MTEPCQACPCPATCLRRATFCAWAARSPQDPVEVLAIVNRSALGEVPLAAPEPGEHVPGPVMAAVPCCGGGAGNPYDYLLSPPSSSTAADPPAGAGPA